MNRSMFARNTGPVVYSHASPIIEGLRDFDRDNYARRVRRVFARAEPTATGTYE